MDKQVHRGASLLKSTRNEDIFFKVLIELRFHKQFAKLII